VRRLVLILASTVVLGSSSGAVAGWDTQRARELLAGIFDDVGAILSSFEGGPTDARSPVTNQLALKQDSARLDAATRRAEQLATELSKLETQASERGH
jgi:hypothetical protein